MRAKKAALKGRNRLAGPEVPIYLLSELGRRSGEVNLSGIEQIGPVGNLQSAAYILLNQQDRHIGFPKPGN